MKKLFKLFIIIVIGLSCLKCKKDSIERSSKDLTAAEPEPVKENKKAETTTEAEPEPAAEKKKTEMIKVELKADPLELTMSERKNFKIGIAATNNGDEVIDPELHLAKLFVNGEWSKVWSLAIGNGAREKKWFALPPGETVSLTWPTLGKSLFPEPGTFDLVLSYGGKDLSPIQVKVSAD